MKPTTLVTAFVGFCAMATTLSAQGFDLEVSGLDGSSKVFTFEELEALPQTTFETETIWTDGDQEFTGVSLAALLREADVDGETLRMTALNDYAVEMPMDEIGDEFPIVAIRLNGDTISVRDKGPFWIVYPFDSAPEYQTETTFSRSVWQLKALTVTE